MCIAGPATAISHRFGLRLFMCPSRSGPSERELQRAVHVVAVAGGSRLMNEVPRIEVVVAGVAEHVPIELIRRDQVRLRADVARGRAGAWPEHRSGVVIETVVNAGAPEVIVD